MENLIKMWIAFLFVFLFCIATLSDENNLHIFFFVLWLVSIMFWIYYAVKVIKILI